MRTHSKKVHVSLAEMEARRLVVRGDAVAAPDPDDRRPVHRPRAKAALEAATGLPWRFTIEGAPPLMGARVVFRRWLAAALVQAPGIRAQGAQGTVTAPLTLTATFYGRRRLGSLKAHAAALAAFLQEAGFIGDARLIHWHEDSRLAVDHARPRIDVAIALNVPPNPESTWATS